MLVYANEHNGRLSDGACQAMVKVLERYDEVRTKALMDNGFPKEAIDVYVRTWVDKVSAWMDKETARTPLNAADFEAWARELEE